MIRRIAPIALVILALAYIGSSTAFAAGPSGSTMSNVLVNYGQFKDSTPTSPLESRTYAQDSTGQFSPTDTDASLRAVTIRRHAYLRLSLLPGEIVRYTNVYYSNDKLGFGFNRQDWTGKTPLPQLIHIVVDNKKVALTIAFVDVGVYNPALPVPAMNPCTASCGD